MKINVILIYCKNIYFIFFWMTEYDKKGTHQNRMPISQFQFPFKEAGFDLFRKTFQIIKYFSEDCIFGIWNLWPTTDTCLDIFWEVLEDYSVLNTNHNMLEPCLQLDFSLRNNLSTRNMMHTLRHRWKAFLKISPTF